MKHLGIYSSFFFFFFNLGRLWLPFSEIYSMLSVTFCTHLLNHQDPQVGSKCKYTQNGNLKRTWVSDTHLNRWRDVAAVALTIKWSCVMNCPLCPNNLHPASAVLQDGEGHMSISRQQYSPCTFMAYQSQVRLRERLDGQRPAFSAQGRQRVKDVWICSL